jgi:hypothetical protein
MRKFWKTHIQNSPALGTNDTSAQEVFRISFSNNKTDQCSRGLGKDSFEPKAGFRIF